MEQRCAGVDDVVGLPVPAARQLVAEVDHVVLRHHRALRRARGAGRVHDGGRVFGPGDVVGLHDLGRGVEQRGDWENVEARRGTGHFAIPDEERAQGRQLRAHCQDLRGEFGVGQDDGRAGVVQLMPEELPPVGGVHRDLDGADGGGGEQRGDLLLAVLHEEADGVAGPDTEFEEPVGRRPGPLEELPVGHRVVAEVDGHLVGMAVRPALQHRHEGLAFGARPRHADHRPRWLISNYLTIFDQLVH